MTSFLDSNTLSPPDLDSSITMDVKSSRTPVPTPRRKLSMSVESMDETTPQSQMQTSFEDNGYRGSFSCAMTSPPVMFSVGNVGSSSSCRYPLGEIQPNVPEGGGRRTCLAKRRPPPERGIDKENMSPRDFAFPLAPCSLPNISPCTQGKGLYRQISSPMGQMSLQSPTSRPSSTTSISESSDGYFSEVFDGEEVEEQPLSCALSSLISATTFDPTPMTNRFSYKNEVVCPTPIRPTSFHQEEPKCKEFMFSQRKGSLKRSSPMSDLSNVHRSKRRPLPFCSNSQDSPPATNAKPTLLRSQSCCMPPAQLAPTPFSPGAGEESFIGDFSKPYALPLVEGSVRDLKCISPETLCNLLNGKYEDTVHKYSILDCRFPYEYEGGHVRDSKNVWTQEQLLEMLLSEPLQHPNKEMREVYILHCEFSSKRGPKMSRFLREMDRKINGMEGFPKLYYPELYLLDGGYNAFYAAHPEMCEPQSYCCMIDENHMQELRTCKLRSKSWNEDTQATRRRPSAVARHRHSTHSVLSYNSASSKHTE